MLFTMSSGNCINLLYFTTIIVHLFLTTDTLFYNIIITKTLVLLNKYLYTIYILCTRHCLIHIATVK